MRCYGSELDILSIDVKITCGIVSSYAILQISMIPEIVVRARCPCQTIKRTQQRDRLTRDKYVSVEQLIYLAPIEIGHGAERYLWTKVNIRPCYAVSGP